MLLELISDSTLKTKLLLLLIGAFGSDDLERSVGEGNGNPLQYSLPGESHGQRRLAGYSPLGCKELGMTK